jgi:hydrogenase nickel incorporation protein HypA/HybF
MHEMSVTQELLEMALAEAKKNGAKSVTQINLVIGSLSGVVAESVQFYFDFLSQGTAAQDARVNVKTAPFEVRCRKCQTVFQPEDECWSCPQCQQWEVEILSGKELYLESIEVEE